MDDSNVNTILFEGVIGAHGSKLVARVTTKGEASAL